MKNYKYIEYLCIYAQISFLLTFAFSCAASLKNINFHILKYALE